MPVKLTDRAIERFGQLRASSEGDPRIEIRAGGCNGFEKYFSWTKTRYDDDMVIETATGPVIIDSMSYDMLYNATVDYRTDLAGAYFAIDIPEAASTCGCGTSFSL
jgi:iron-sulfur cluster assembly accessory protein